MTLMAKGWRKEEAEMRERSETTWMPMRRVGYLAAADACKAEAEKLEAAERAVDSLREDVRTFIEGQRCQAPIHSAMYSRVLKAMAEDFAARKWPGFDAKEGS